MLSPKELQSFFEDNKIPLESSSFIGEEAVITIFSKGIGLGYYFASFLLVAIFNPEKNSFQSNFDNFEDLYEAYSCYMTGCSGFKC